MKEQIKKLNLFIISRYNVSKDDNYVSDFNYVNMFRKFKYFDVLNLKVFIKRKSYF